MQHELLQKDLSLDEAEALQKKYSLIFKKKIKFYFGLKFLHS